MSTGRLEWSSTLPNEVGWYWYAVDPKSRREEQWGPTVLLVEAQPSRYPDYLLFWVDGGYLDIKRLPKCKWAKADVPSNPYEGESRGI